MRGALVLVVLGTWLVGARAEATPAPPDPDEVARSLDGGVAFAVSGGLWQTSGGYGRYRVVVVSGGVEHVSMRIYAQWLEFNEASGRDSVLQSVAVAELNNSLALVRDVEIAEQGANRLVFRFTREARDPGPLEHVSLELKLPGEIKVLQSSKPAKLGSP